MDTSIDTNYFREIFISSKIRIEKIKTLKNTILLNIIILLSTGLHAQANLDSLWNVWEDDTKADTSRLKALDDYTYHGYIQKQSDSAIYFAQIQLEFAQAKGLKAYSADAFDNLGRAYEDNGELSAAINCFQQTHDLNEELGNQKKMSYALYQIGGANWTAGDYETAKIYHRRALTIAYEIGDNERVYLCLNGIAYCFFQQGSYDTAMLLVQKSLKLSEEIGNDDGIAWGLNAMGVFYSRQGNIEKALEYYLKGLEINERIGDRSSTSYSLRNIGNTYSRMGDDEKALEFIERSLLLDEKLNDKRGLATSLSSLAHIYSSNGENEKAMEYFQRSLALSREIGNRDMECEECRDIGWLHLEQGNYLWSISECQKSYEIALDIGSVVDQLEACECLYEAHKALGEYDKALVFHEKMLVLKDSINIKSLANNLREMEFTRQMFADSLMHEEDKLKMDLAYQAELGEKDRTKNIFIISGIIILLIALGLWNRVRFVRKANARLKKERDRAEKSEQFKHQFLANMSHEIRTPMNAIKGMSDILIRRQPTADQLKYLNAIKQSSNSLLVIINDILDLSKIEVGKVELEHIPFSINEVIKNIHIIMQFKAEEKGLALQLDIPNSIPQVSGDPTRLRQVIINLLGNAIKFTEKGMVTTSLQIEIQEKDGIAQTHFIVSDTGIGIEQEKLDQVFNSFEQAYADTSRKFGGTGLGLSISKKLIELQGGEIWVESKKGVGSQFHFTLPFILAQDTETIALESQTPDIENVGDQLKGIRVLLVEDNAFNAVVAKEELEDAIQETTVTVAENGSIAVEQISHNEFDIVLMDVQMPVMNGYEATKAIRDLDGKKSKIPIIAMTANVMKEEVEFCYKAGMNDFIGKPFDTEILIQKIYALTNLKS